MKKFIILVILVLAFFTVDYPPLNEYRTKLFGDGVAILSESTKINRSPVANLTKTMIAKQLTLSESEREYIDKAFTTDDSVRLFHLHYCQERDLNLYFYEKRLDKVCHVINDALEMKRK
jgi:hypothetical protein